MVLSYQNPGRLLLGVAAAATILSVASACKSRSRTMSSATKDVGYVDPITGDAVDLALRPIPPRDGKASSGKFVQYQPCDSLTDASAPNCSGNAKAEKMKCMGVGDYLGSLGFATLGFPITDEGLALAQNALKTIETTPNADPATKAKIEKAVTDLRALIAERDKPDSIITALKSETTSTTVYKFDTRFPNLMEPFTNDANKGKWGCGIFQANAQLPPEKTPVEETKPVTPPAVPQTFYSQNVSTDRAGVRATSNMTTADVKDNAGNSLGTHLVIQQQTKLTNSAGRSYEYIVIAAELGDDFNRTMTTSKIIDQLIAKGGGTADIQTGEAPDAREHYSTWWAVNGPPMIAIRTITLPAPTPTVYTRTRCSDPMPAFYHGGVCCSDGYWEQNKPDGSPPGCRQLTCQNGAPEPTCFEGATCCGDGLWHCNYASGRGACADVAGNGGTNRCVFGSFSGRFSSCADACSGLRSPSGGLAECYGGLCIGQCRGGSCSRGVNGQNFDVRGQRLFVCVQGE